jgi:hypothetical protein
VSFENRSVILRKIYVEVKKIIGSKIRNFIFHFYPIKNNKNFSPLFVFSQAWFPPMQWQQKILKTLFFWEGVGTSNLTTTNGDFFQNIKNGFWVDYYIKNQCLFSWSLLQKSERWKEWKEHRKSQFCQIFEVILPMA